MGRGYKKASAVGGAAAVPTPRGLGPPQPALGVPRWAQRCGAAGNARCFGGVPPAGPPVHLPGAGGGGCRSGGGTAARRYQHTEPDGSSGTPLSARPDGPSARNSAAGGAEGTERNGTGGGPTSRPRHRGRHKGGCVRGAANKAALSWDRGGTLGFGEGGDGGGWRGGAAVGGCRGGRNPRSPNKTRRGFGAVAVLASPRRRARPAPRPQHMAAAPPAALPARSPHRARPHPRDLPSVFSFWG